MFNSRARGGSLQNQHLSPKEEGLAVIRHLLFVCFANENQRVGSSCSQLQGSQLTPLVSRAWPGWAMLLFQARNGSGEPGEAWRGF